MKGFREAVRDGYKRLKTIYDPLILKQYKEEGVQMEYEDIYSFTFGDQKEYEQRIEPIGEEGQYQIALYKNGILINHKLIVKGIN